MLALRICSLLHLPISRRSLTTLALGPAAVAVDVDLAFGCTIAIGGIDGEVVNRILAPVIMPAVDDLAGLHFGLVHGLLGQRRRIFALIRRDGALLEGLGKVELDLAFLEFVGGVGDGAVARVDFAGIFAAVHASLASRVDERRVSSREALGADGGCRAGYGGESKSQGGEGSETHFE